MVSTRWMPGPLRVEVHLTGQETAGRLCLLVDHPRPGWSLPPHRHADEDETIHVVEGRFENVIDGHRSESGPGDTVHIPRGTLHSGGVIGAEPGRRVVVFSPAGVERLFLVGGAEREEDAPRGEELLRLAGECGWRFG